MNYLCCFKHHLHLSECKHRRNPACLDWEADFCVIVCGVVTTILGVVVYSIIVFPSYTRKPIKGRLAEGYFRSFFDCGEVIDVRPKRSWVGAVTSSCSPTKAHFTRSRSAERWIRICLGNARSARNDDVGGLLNK